jgi:uncharacterized protein
MASASTDRPLKAPALAATYAGDDPELLRRISPLLDVIEIAPDPIAREGSGAARIRQDVLAEYASVAADVRFTVHGLGLSIGSFDSWHDDHLRVLDELFEHVAVAWHSEHLGCSRVGGESLGTMLALPRTTEAVDLVCERARAIQRRYAIPFLLEHVAGLLPESPAAYSPAEFLNAIARESGCGLVLDAYNLECDVDNHDLDLQRFLDELDFSAVRELHVAGGVRYKGACLDIHSSITGPSTLALAVEILRRAPGLELVTFEFLKEAVPLLGHDAICSELLRLREVISS